MVGVSRDELIIHVHQGRDVGVFSNHEFGGNGGRGRHLGSNRVDRPRGDTLGNMNKGRRFKGVLGLPALAVLAHQ